MKLDLFHQEWDLLYKGLENKMERTCQIFDLTGPPNPLIREEIEKRRDEVENMPNIVRYKLNNPAERVLKGSYRVLMRVRKYVLFRKAD